MGEGNQVNAINNGGRSRILLQLVVVALSIVTIWYFMRKYSADISSLRQIEVTDILIIGAWSFFSYTAYAYAVYIVLLDLGLQGLRPIGWIKIYFVSRLVNFMVLQGGNLYRLFILKKNYNFSYTSTVGVTGFLIFVNAIVAVTISIFALLTMEKSYSLIGQSLTFWLVLVVIGLVGFLLVLVQLSKLAQSSKIARSRFVEPFMEIADFLVGLLRKRRLLFAITTLSIVHFVAFVGVNYFSFHAIGHNIQLNVVCIFTATFVFTRYVNIVPGNIGISELVGGLVSEQMGVGFGNGLIVTGIVRMVEVLLILCLGLLYGNFKALSFIRRK